MGRSLGGVWAAEEEEIVRAKLCPQSSAYSTYLLFPSLVWAKPEAVNQGRTKISSNCCRHYLEGNLDWRPAEIFLEAELGMRWCLNWLGGTGVQSAQASPLVCWRSCQPMCPHSRVAIFAGKLFIPYVSSPRNSLSSNNVFKTLWRSLFTSQIEITRGYCHS